MRPSSFTLAFLASTFLITGACVDTDTSILILQNQLPSDECGPTTDPTAPFIGRGRVDTNTEFGYVLSPIVQNNAITGDDNINKIYLLEGADVDLTAQSGFEGAFDDILLSFSQRFSGVIQPNGGITFLVFEIISRGFLDVVAAMLPADGTLLQVKAEIQIFGQMQGGGMKSQTFTYWVDVCNGCLEPTVIGVCDEVPNGFIAAQGSCYGLQDFALDCCTDATSGNLVCPATSAGTL